MMIQLLESRQLFAVAPIGHSMPSAEPVAEPEAGIVVVSNDLGPENVQKKHVSSVKTTAPAQ